MTRGANPETAIVNEVCLGLGMYEVQAKIKVYHMYVGGIFNQSIGCYQKTGPFHPVGLSDVMVLASGGRTFWLECKVPGGRQREDQVEFQRIVESLGFVYAVVNNAYQAREVLCKAGVIGGELDRL